MMTGEGVVNDPFGPQRAVVASESSTWTGGVVPYVISSSLGTNARTAITEAMNDYTTRTCITFVARTTQTDYVEFFRGNGCYSNIGRIRGRQRISIGNGCERKGTVIHEIFHALGRWHEQSRPDRDQYVEILTQNIRSGLENNFDRVSTRIATTNGISYDFDSLMHYPSTAFSNNGQPTIRPIDPSIPSSRLGNRRGFSSRDVDHVNALYRCPGTTGVTGTWSAWSGWSSCTRTCNGGTRSRSRSCVGGTGCTGANVQEETCNTQACATQTFWSSWGSWSGCSRSCGGGQQVRTRRCNNGDNCPGSSRQYQACNTNTCPSTSVWSSWSRWSACSQTCEGGSQRRVRSCVDQTTGERRYDCMGEGEEIRTCNNGVTCATTTSGVWSAWSACSRECGGGRRTRTRSCDAQGRGCQVETEDCNTDPCSPEPELRGLSYAGCFYYFPRYSNLNTLEGVAEEISDTYFNRTEPIRKCGQASRQYNYTIFGLINGYCVSGNDLDEFMKLGSSMNCQKGIGDIRLTRYNRRYYYLYSMDVYRISNSVSFDVSVEAILNPQAGSGAEATCQVHLLTLLLLFVCACCLQFVW